MFAGTDVKFTAVLVRMIPGAFLDRDFPVRCARDGAAPGPTPLALPRLSGVDGICHGLSRERRMGVSPHEQAATILARAEQRVIRRTD